MALRIISLSLSLTDSSRNKFRKCNAIRTTFTNDRRYKYQNYTTVIVVNEKMKV